MRSKGWKITAKAAVVGLLATGLVVTSQGASAQSCTAAAFKGSTWTEAFVTGANPCYHAQARIIRLDGGWIYTYYGAQSSYSFVSNSRGYNAGNHFRVQGTPGGPWTSWLSV